MFKKISYIFLTVFILQMIPFASSHAASSTFIEGFENGGFDKLWSYELASKASGQIVKDNSATGDYSLRIEVNKNDPDVFGRKRAEINLSSENPLEEHWYSVSIFLPKDGKENYALDNDCPESLIQWHNTPDKGEEWTSSPLALETYGGNYIISRLWDDAALSTDAEIIRKGNRKEYTIGSIEEDKGKWVRWTFHVKWGWKVSQKPILEVYKNGTKVLDCSGLPNTTNDKKGVYMKVGVYKWGWSSDLSNSVVSKRVVYYDDVTIDNAAEIEKCKRNNSFAANTVQARFYDAFENGRVNDSWGTEYTKPISASIVSNNAVADKKLLRFELNRNDPDVCGDKRSLIKLDYEQQLEEHWYSFNIFLPEKGDEDYKNDTNSAEGLLIWENKPDEGDKETVPPLSLQTVNGHYMIKRFWDDSENSDLQQLINKGYYSESDLGSYSEDKGKWVKWVFHVKWGWEKSQNPKLEVFKDGVMVLNCNGLPNTYNDKSGVRLKVGINKWDWSVPNSSSVLSKRVVYFSSISIDNNSDIPNSKQVFASK